jgi:hypothetical protein
MMIGEMCPEAASGRPAVMPVFLRTLNWSAQNEDLSAAIERNRAPQFSVLGWSGERAGIFSVIGAGDAGLERKVALGAYAGRLPCATGDAGENGDCVAAQERCGVAVAELGRGGMAGLGYAEDPDPATVVVAGACLSGGKVLVDIDGDGSEEAYPAEAFLDAIRQPSEEVMATTRGNERCKPAFAVRGMLPPGDPRHWRGMDLLAVLDIDGDGRRELVMSYNYSERRTWAVYSARVSAGRLDLVGEAVPWPSGHRGPAAAASAEAGALIPVMGPREAGEGTGPGRPQSGALIPVMGPP